MDFSNDFDWRALQFLKVEMDEEGLEESWRRNQQVLEIEEVQHFADMEDSSLISRALIDINKDPLLSDSLFYGNKPSAEFKDFPNQLELYKSEVVAIDSEENAVKGEILDFGRELKDENEEGASFQERKKPSAEGTELEVDDEVLVNIKQEPLEEIVVKLGPCLKLSEEKAVPLSRQRPSRRRQARKEAGYFDMKSDLDELDDNNVQLQLRPKKARKCVPEDEKDAEYFAMRKRNTLAARRSRQKKREIDEERVSQIKSLLAEVKVLRAVSVELEKEEKELRRSEEDLQRWKQLVNTMFLAGGPLNKCGRNLGK